MCKEKIVQIYEAMADMTLEMINKERKSVLCLDEDELEMVRTTQSLYETINYANQPAISTASTLNVLNDLENDCKYTDRPDAAGFGDLVPMDSSGTKYSPESSSISCPLSDVKKIMKNVGKSAFNC